MFLSTNKKVTGIWNFEVGSRKPMEKAEDIQFHPWNTTYIFTAVKIQLLIFSRLWKYSFFKYALYLNNIFLYFITLYIIKNDITMYFWPLNLTKLVREHSGSVVECLTRDQRAAVQASPVSLCCGPWARHIYPSLVLVQPRKTCPYITERLLMGRKESNQTKPNCSVVCAMAYILFACW